MSHLQHFVGNRNPSLYDTIRISDDPISLSGASVKLKIRLATGSTLKVDATADPVTSASTLVGSHSFPLADGTLELLDASAFLPEGAVTIAGQVIEYTGVAGNFLTGCTGGEGTFTNGTAVAQRGGVRYDWTAGDITAPNGLLSAAAFAVGWWEVTQSGKTQDTPEFEFEVVAHSPFTGALCTLDQVREFLQKKNSEREQDTVIQMLILRASRSIHRYTGRELAPATADATRRFRVYPDRRLRGRIAVEFSPGRNDLRNVDVGGNGYVKLNPEASPTTLTAADYVLEQHRGDEPVYTGLLLRKDIRIDSQLHTDFGFGQLEIRGAWGFPTVPEDVEQCAVVTVGTWMRRDVQAWGSSILVEDPIGRLERPEALPSAVRSMLSDYRKGPFA